MLICEQFLNKTGLRSLKNIPIKVSGKVLRHMSRGIYRTPAGALKELVINGYDAGAKKVTINTGWPVIEKITVTDNGTGMTLDTFKYVIQNIGLSRKKAGEKFPIPSSTVMRTTVGHYGIGFLAAGQLSASIKIISKVAGSKKGFSAEINFEQFELIKDGDSVQRSKIKDESEIEKADKEDAGFEVGKCSYEENAYLDKEFNAHFTRIELTNIRKEVYYKLIKKHAELNPDVKNMKEYAANFEDILRTIRDQENWAKQGAYPYERLIWELGIYCPVKYPEISIFKGDLKEIAEIAESNEFEVVIDGIQVKKVYEKFFFNDKEFPILKKFKWINEPYTENPDGPKVSGYFVFKTRIRPKTIQGVLIRESGVAIGSYDTTFLEYPFNEGQKFNQLTGEIYAEGLSGSLNIDRNSFNETDERYLKLCDWLHGKLNKEVFPAIKKLQKGPNASAREKNREYIKLILDAFVDFKRKDYKIVFKPLGKNEQLLNKQKNLMIINSDHPDGGGSSSKVEKVIILGALVIDGLIKPNDIERVFTEIEETEKLLKEK